MIVNWAALRAGRMLAIAAAALTLVLLASEALLHLDQRIEARRLRRMAEKSAESNNQNS